MSATEDVRCSAHLLLEGQDAGGVLEEVASKAPLVLALHMSKR